MTTINSRYQLKNVRLAFPNLFEATRVGTDPSAKPRFSASFILAPDHPQVAELKELITHLAKEKWGKDAEAMLKAIRAKDRICLHDGDLKAKYEGFAGNLYVSAAAPENKPPTVVDTARVRLDARSPIPYAGCLVNAIVEIYAQDNSFGKGINATLAGVQFVADGQAFGGGRAASEDEFEEIATDGASGDWA